MLRTTFFFLLFLLVANFTPAVGQKQSSVKNNLNPCLSLVAETIDLKIDRVAACHGLPARLFRSLIWAESANRPRALSYKGAACLTQLMPGTARRYGLRVDAAIDERYNIDKCLNGGARYLSDLLRWFKGDVRLALAGYNAGEGAVYKHNWRVPPFRETVQYVEKILYIYLGQRGHGVTAAFNQPLAQAWVNNLYTRRFARPAEVDRPVKLTVSSNPITEIAEKIDDNDGDTPEKNSVENKPAEKRKTSRVQIAEIKPRLKTTSSFFWRMPETPDK